LSARPTFIEGRSAEKNDSRSPRSATEATGSPGHFSHMALRVYLVDDSPIISELIRELVEGIGATLVGKADAANTAISEIRALHPDVVVVDIRLREGTGFDVLKALRVSFATKPPVYMMLTNYVNDAYRDAAKALGVDYFFDKSRQISEMLRVLGAMPNSVGETNGN
jgi:CheY-like chemotaxis protein